MALDHSRLGMENKLFPTKITQLPTQRAREEQNTGGGRNGLKKKGGGRE